MRPSGYNEVIIYSKEYEDEKELEVIDGEVVEVEIERRKEGEIVFVGEKYDLSKVKRIYFKIENSLFLLAQ